MLHYLFFILSVYFVRGIQFHNTNLTDITKCKLTQLGTEYIGSKTTTAGEIPCKPWFLEKSDSVIKDEDFPEMSIKNAKNYCRNPTKDQRGPWCYTMESTLIDDECGIPLCNYGECRISGIGAEYCGSVKISSSEKKCKSWNNRYKLTTEKTSKFANNRFSDGSRNKAGKFCRNPDNSLGGPWCYVEEENFEFVKKEFCNVPFCDHKDCVVYARNSSVYSTITKLNASLGNVTFWIKLWNPSDEREAEMRILLSLLPIPTSAERIAQDWRAGVELKLSNLNSGQTFPHVHDHDFENSPNILLGSKWTGVWATWAGGFISMGLVGSTKPLFMDEYRLKNTISSLYPQHFLYYSAMGTGVLWTTEFCLEKCEVHITFGMEFLRIWPLQQNNGTSDVLLYVRASHNIAIRFYQTPATPFPCVTLTIGDVDTMSLTYQESEESLKQYLKTAPSHGIIDFWTWNEFSISIFGPQLRLFSKKIYGEEEILFLSHTFFASLKWFSVGSEETIAYWTLFCKPDESNAVEEPSLPNCSSSPTEYAYHGSQWTGAGEKPCAPWISEEIPDDEKKDDQFIDGSVIQALNMCRNPLKDPQGPYCYTLSHEITSSISKEYCHIRACRSFECRRAGTANDYIGTLSSTRSGRKCIKWKKEKQLKNITANNATRAFTVTTPSFSSVVQELNITDNNSEDDVTPTTSSLQTFLPGSLSETEASTTSFEETRTESTSKSVSFANRVNPAYLNDSLYPEHSAGNASNYCRNPSRNIAGTWCYTTDPQVPQDLCDVQDCDKPEECTFLVRGQGLGRRLYILPEHRSEGLHISLKAWEPDNPDSITIVFTADDGYRSQYHLTIGAMNNEQVILHYQSEEEDLKLVKKKTLPHLLFIGKWSSFVIRVPRGKVELYFEGAPHPLFEWEHPDSKRAFLPVYYFYSSQKGNTIGVAFDCNSRCIIENTKSNQFTRIIPLSTQSLQVVPKPQEVQFLIRANGVVEIPLFLLPTTPGYYSLTLNEPDHWIYFIKKKRPKAITYHKQKATGLLFTSNTWTNITLKWDHNTMTIFRNESQVFHYEHSSELLFYYFSLSVNSGSWATWTANCLPTDIDGDPKDGGWSEWGPWTCSASCNGGVGTRRRYCNNPEANIKGEPCLGPNYMSGRCNTIICGDIVEDTEYLMKRRIRRNQTSLIVKEGDPVTILSDKDIIDRINSESPNSHVRWSLNGVYVEEEKGRVKMENYNIIIKRSILNDSGVYAMTLHRVDESDTIFKIVSLAVQPIREAIIIRETLSMFVKCQCTILGYVYSDLKVTWFIGTTIWKDYGTTLPMSVNVDFVPGINKSHSGLWKCIVKQDDLGFNWTTNMLFVKVLGAPNWRTHLMEDKLTRPIFGLMPSETFVSVSVVVLFIIFLSCVVLGTMWIIQFRSSLKVDIFGKLKSAEHTEPLRKRQKDLESTASEESSANEDTTEISGEESPSADAEKQQLLR